MYNHHKLSHGSTTDGGTMNTLPETDWRAALHNVDVWYATQLKGLLDRLSMYTEPGGSLLDNMTLLYMNDLGDGLGHNWMDLPVMLIGGMKGYFKQGQYIKMTAGTGTANDKDAPTNQLLTTLANGMGVRDDQLRQRPDRQGRRADRAQGLKRRHRERSTPPLPFPQRKSGRFRGFG